MSALRLGKKPATYDPRDRLYTQYRQAAELPPIPPTFGHADAFTDWLMLGNDTAGDCVFAGGDHEVMLWNRLAGRAVTVTTDNALADYSAVTGYDPTKTQPDGSNPTDQGTNVRDALNYRVSTGLLDAQGNRHPIGAFVSLEPGNYQHLLEAVYIFDAVGIGIQFPNSAMDQFNAGQPWSVVPGAQVQGGHYIPIVGLPAADLLQVVTWAKTQLMTEQFYQTYCDEAWAFWSVESINAQGKNPEGFDLAALKADLALV
jgi:hypothetical protein